MPLTDLHYQVICSRSISKVETELIIMIPISEKEEAALDKGLLVTKRDGFQFTIDKSTVICYGEIDFHDSSDDFNVIVIYTNKMVKIINKAIVIIDQ